MVARVCACVQQEAGTWWLEYVHVFSRRLAHSATFLWLCRYSLCVSITQYSNTCCHYGRGFDEITGVFVKDTSNTAQSMFVCLH